MQTTLPYFPRVPSHVVGSCFIWLGLLLFAGPWAEAEAKAPAKVVLIAGPITGHPKETHEYEKAVTLIKHCLDSSPNVPTMQVSAHYQGWPQDPEVLEQADVILLVSDGSDHDETMHPLYRDDHFDALRQAMNRGCGLMLLHWSTFHPSRFHDQITEWVGGYFDYETGPEPRRWFSRIQTWEDRVHLASPGHPVLEGVQPFDLKDEYYYHLRFRPADSRLQHILQVEPPGEEGGSYTVAWAVEREQGARGFGFTGGHFHDSWWLPDFRRMLLNAVLWTAGCEVPKGGVQSELAPRQQVMILTGHQHPAHLWKETTLALMHAMELDPRCQVSVSEQPEEWLLGHPDLGAYDLLVMNYCNWEKPGWDTQARQRLDTYVREGGGLAVIHFGNGAFHRSLPGAADSDWPGYRKLVRRVWDHDGSSGHDPYGAFEVLVSPVLHPITAGLKSFTTEDELYYHQAGEEPIQALVHALSTTTGRYEPLAWAYQVGEGRVFQTLLGHAATSIDHAANLIQRGCTWAAGRVPLTFDPPALLAEQAIPRQGDSWRP